jgi:hypothetical protein
MAMSEPATRSSRVRQKVAASPDRLFTAAGGRPLLAGCGCWQRSVPKAAVRASRVAAVGCDAPRPFGSVRLIPDGAGRQPPDATRSARSAPARSRAQRLPPVGRFQTIAPSNTP